MRGDKNDIYYDYIINNQFMVDEDYKSLYDGFFLEKEDYYFILNKLVLNNYIPYVSEGKGKGFFYYRNMNVNLIDEEEEFMEVCEEFRNKIISRRRDQKLKELGI